MPLTVLAVEHDPALRSLYYALLAERGHRVRVVPSGEDALRHLDIDIDVVVVDLRSKQSAGTSGSGRSPRPCRLPKGPGPGR